MLRVKVNLEKDGKQTTEEYDVLTIQQLKYQFRGKHIADKAVMKSFEVLYEYEYTIIDTRTNKIMFRVREKTRERALGTLKQRVGKNPLIRKFIVKEIPREKDILEDLYRVGEIFEVGCSESRLPDYLKELGEWKKLGSGKFKRIS